MFEFKEGRRALQVAEAEGGGEGSRPGTGETEKGARKWNVEVAVWVEVGSSSRRRDEQRRLGRALVGSAQPRNTVLRMLHHGQAFGSI